MIKVLGILLEYFCTYGLRMFPRRFFLNQIVEYLSTENKTAKVVKWSALHFYLQLSK